MSRVANKDFPILTYLDGLVDNLRDKLSPAMEGKDADAVHDARVATRRLRAATSLLESVVSNRCRRPFDKATKCIRRQLGPLRDLDVMIEHLGEFKEMKFSRAIAWLRDRLVADRDKLLAEAHDESPPSRMLARLGSWWGLRYEIVEARDSIGLLLAESVHLQLDAFDEQASQLIQARGNDPHQLRIAGKHLRYTLEMAREHGFKVPGSAMSLFKRMQKSLGDWHDYIVLTERILKQTVDCDLALHDPQLQEIILSFAQFTLRKAQVHLRRMAQLWKTRGESLTHAIRHAFPLTTKVKLDATDKPASQTPPKSADVPSDDVTRSPAA